MVKGGIRLGRGRNSTWLCGDKRNSAWKSIGSSMITQLITLLVKVSIAVTIYTAMSPALLRYFIATFTHTLFPSVLSHDLSQPCQRGRCHSALVHIICLLKFHLLLNHDRSQLLSHLFRFESFIALVDPFRSKDQVIRTEGIDFDLAELTSADSVFEQDIEISIGKTLGFWQAEVCLQAR